MRPNWIAAALCATLAAGAPPAAAQSVSYIYNYTTPLVSVVAGLQIGKSVEIASAQTSASNVFSVTQIAPVARAIVLQHGAHSLANVVQIGGPLPSYWLGGAP